MSSAISTHRLPAAIERKLRFVRRRHAVLATSCALAYGTAVLIFAMMLSMAVDWMFPFAEPALRFVLTGGTLAAAVATITYLGWQPVRQALQWNHAADSVDDGIPELEERWSTVASLSAVDPSKLSPIQRAMADQVTSEAVAMDKVVVPSLALSPVTLRPAMLLAAASTLLLLASVLVFPAHVSVLLKRFWSPSSQLTATQLDSLSGDQLVPRGESIELTSRLDGIPRSSGVLTVVDRQGIVQEFVLRPDEQDARTFTHRVRVEETLQYRFRAGDGQTRWHQLQAIDYPEIADVRFEIEFPEYTERPSVERDRIPKRIKVVQGSKLNVALRPAQPLETLQVAITHPDRSRIENQSDDASQEFELAADEEGWYRFRMQLTEDTIFRPSLLSPHGLANQRRLFSRIDVIADKAPVARIVTPNEAMAVSLEETIDIEFEAHDDHGVATAELVVYDESQRDADGNPRVLETQPIDLGDQESQKHIMGKTQLNLAELDLNAGSQISYAIRVTDNRHVELENGPMQAPQMAMASEPTSETDSATAASHESFDPKAMAESADRNNAAEGGGSEPSPRTVAADASGSPPVDSNESATREDTSPITRSPPVDSDKLASAEPTTGDDTEMKSDALTADSAEAGSNGNPQDGNIAKSDQPGPTEEPTSGKPAENEGQPDDRAVAAGGDPLKPVAEAPADADAAADANATADANAAADDNAAADQVASADQGANAEPNASTDKNATSETAADMGRPADADTTRKDALAGTQTDGKSGAPNDANSASSNTNNANKQPRTTASSQVAGNARNNQRMANNNPNRTPNSPTPPSPYTLTSQQSRQGQNTLTNRRQLKITEKLAAISEAEDRPGEDRSIRESVVEIESMLAEAETGLRLLVDGLVADSDRAEQLRRLDVRLGSVEEYVAELREQTKENQFAFVGLQMVDITRTNVTPARDRVFAAIQRPVASDADASAALGHVVRARESLAALLKRYDRVQRERNLERSIAETVKMYEVYVEKRRILMRETRQNRNPLERKMAVIEVDQDYLDRLAEVQTLRREMIDGFAQMLGDDPRLLSRYLELIKRRGRSLRDQLTEISERQYEATEESLSWLQIDDAQKMDLWSIIVELRLNSARELAQDAAQLAERIEKQMPLSLKNDVGTPAAIIRQAKLIASRARTVSFDAERIANNGGKVDDRSLIASHAGGLINECNALFALLDRLQFEHGDDEGVTDYLEPRFLESRSVADQADAWTLLSESLAGESYAGLVHTEQHRLAVTTQLLRVEMLDMENDLEGQFRRLAESDLPGEIKDMIRNLHRLMEAITFNQAAASFRASQNDLESMAAQQELALARLEEAEDLFDKIRRTVVSVLDEYDPPDPNIADLQDPTLDEFLARLEREPNITTQLGIPNRRTNLRVISDSVLWQQSGGGGLGDSSNAAAARIKDAMKMKRQRRQGNGEEKSPTEREEQEEKQRQAKQAQEMLEKALMNIKAQRDDEETPAEQRERLEQLAEELEQMLQHARNQDPQSDDPQGQATSGDGERRIWQQIVQSDQANAIVEALARGESLPDQQWNRILSELEDGLWQVRGKQAPEAYRKAIDQYQDQIRQLMQTITEP